jgi:ABC-2 type transport system permease protein
MSAFSLRRTGSTARRVLRQLRHDHRTIALIFFVPSVLISILYFVFDGQKPVFNAIAPLLLAVIPFTIMFIITSVAVLRERTSGTLVRVLTSPATKADVLLGYALAFALLAFVQALITSLVAIGLLGVDVAGPTLLLLVVAVLAGVLGMSYGLLFSAFAKSEFQAVQFMPAFVLPQFLTCGLFVPREHMARLLQYFSDIMPLTYVVKTAQELGLHTSVTGTFLVSLTTIIGFIVLALSLGALTLRTD